MTAGSTFESLVLAGTRAEYRMLRRSCVEFLLMLPEFLSTKATFLLTKAASLQKMRKIRAGLRMGDFFLMGDISVGGFFGLEDFSKNPPTWRIF